MKHAENKHSAVGNAVCGNIRSAVDDEFAGAIDATDAATFEVTNQLL